MAKGKRKKYSHLEKKAYYTGLGVGLTGCGSSSDGLTRKAFNMMTNKEKESYIKGYQKGLDNPSVHSGYRNKGSWF